MLFEQEQKLGFDSRLVVVLFLVFDKFDGDELLVFVVKALDDLAEGALSDDFDQLEPVGDVVSFLDPIVTFFIVKSVVDESLELCWFDLAGILG